MAVPYKQKALWVKEELHEKVKKIAFDTKQQISDLGNQIVEEWLKSQEGKV